MKLRLLSMKGPLEKFTFASKKKTGVPRACKVISKASVQDLDLFRNEVVSLMLLDHPNIIRLVSFFEEDDQVKLLFTLCAGQDAFDRAADVIEAEGHVSEEETAWMLRHMLKALIGCHSKGVVHRDIKPENFVITVDQSKIGSKLRKAPSKWVDGKKPPNIGGLRLIDLGLAKHTTTPSALLEGRRFGTLPYMAPEVLSGKYDYRCDIWSLGVLLFFFVTGDLPFDPPENPEQAKVVSADIKDATYIPRMLKKVTSKTHPWVSDEAKDLIDRMLQFHPDKRISLQEALTHPYVLKHHNKVKNSDKHTSEDECFWDKLDAFAKQTALKRAALLICAHLVPDELTRDQRRIFRAIDVDYNGDLSEEEIQSYISSRGGKLLKAGVYSKIDTDDSGEVNYCEFLAATLPSEISSSVQWTRAVFSILDIDEDGYVTPADLEQLVDGRVSAAALRAVLVEGSGKDKVSFDDFHKMMAT